MAWVFNPFTGTFDNTSAFVSADLNYLGLWNAATNTPTIPAASAANKNSYYIVSVAGTTTINGISSWDVGDWIISNGTAWQKLVGADAGINSVGAGLNLTSGVLSLGDNVGITYTGTTSVAGNFGISNTAPTQLLDIGTSATVSPLMRVTSSSGSSARLQANCFGNASFDLMVNNSGSPILGVSTATMGFGSTQAWPIVFANASTERMRIDASGNVGIGNSNPSQLLDIGSSSTTATFVRATSAGASACRFEMGCFGNVAFDMVANNSGSTVQGVPTATLGFGTAQAWPIVIANSSTERMRVDSSGNLLVNTIATATGKVGIDYTPSSQWQLDLTPDAAGANYVTINNAATYDLASGSGLVGIYANDASAGGLVLTLFGETNIITQSSAGAITVTQGTANKLNVYYNAGTGTYRIENNLGTAKTIIITTIRMRKSV